MLVGAFFPIPLPQALSFALTTLLATLLCTKFTDGKLYPDIILIVLGSEISSSLVTSLVIIPMIS